jgi:hypothetical protein
MSSWITTKSRPKNPIHIIHNIRNDTPVEKLKVFYITNVLIGGSFKYIKDIIKLFPTITFIPITNNQELLKYSREFNSNHILLLQYVISSNINIRNIIELVNKTQIRLVIPIHDFYFLTYSLNEFTTNIHSAYTIHNSIMPEKQQLLNTAKYIIFPSNFVKNEFLRYYNLSNYIVSPHIDYEIKYQKYIPPIKNSTINVGIINIFSECKGIEYYKELIKLTSYNNYNIIYHIFTGDKTFSKYPNIIIYPSYDNENIIKLLHENNIHSLLFLNKWGETYCYSLTHALRSSISILYSNIGSFTERIPLSEHYFPINVDPITKIVKIQDVIDMFFKQLEYIITNITPSYTPDNSNIIIPIFYNNLFI